MDQERIGVLKDYLISSFITFLTMFVVSLAAQLHAGALSTDNFTVSVGFGIICVAARAGIKAVIEGMAGISGAYTVER